MNALDHGSSEGDLWTTLRTSTRARIGLGRAGDALPTSRLLEFRAAHAAARDAVHRELDVAALTQQMEHANLGSPLIVQSRACDRGEYLRRPDLGRFPTGLAHLLASASDIGIVLADGLSAHALEEHGVPAARAIVDALPRHLSVAQPVIATSARVALGDHIGAALDVQTVVVLIGERPGLSFADSLGLYVTHHPRPGRSDSERNCVSNVHPPDGLGYAQAARVVTSLVDGARRLGRSGVELKDTSERVAVEGADTGRGSGG
ncbi:ethanolamine ammonia-lyase subunit EutC [Rhodococcus sp. NPDC060086]|uniref:ethanolamine ammonia-lyase subunit EutC n=1 Tax=Rhodococcus sp. NPDC060086 TaxID=3347055 RepID=UPI00365EAE6B